MLYELGLRKPNSVVGLVVLGIKSRVEKKSNDFVLIPGTMYILL
jgi:hypothetical protein